MLNVYHCLSETSVPVEDGKYDRKQVIYAGDFVIKQGGERQNLVIDKEKIDAWVKTFDELQLLGVTLPVYALHTEHPDEKRGFVVKLQAGPDLWGRYTLWASIDWDKPEYSELYASTDVSLAEMPSYLHTGGKEYTNRLAHIALTDQPVIKGMFPFNKGFKPTAKQNFTLALSEDFFDDELDNGEDASDMDYLKEWAKLLGVPVAEDATEEDIVKAVGDAIAKLKTDYDALKATQKTPDKPGDTPPTTPAPSDEGKGPLQLSEPVVKYMQAQRNQTIETMAASGRIDAGQAKSLREQADKFPLTLSEDSKDPFLALAETAARPAADAGYGGTQTGGQGGGNSPSGQSLMSEVVDSIYNGN